jgi:hypothetical protein
MGGLALMSAAIAAAADAAVGVERVLEQGHARVLRLIEWAAGRCKTISKRRANPADRDDGRNIRDLAPDRT